MHLKRNIAGRAEEASDHRFGLPESGGTLTLTLETVHSDGNSNTTISSQLAIYPREKRLEDPANEELRSRVDATSGGQLSQRRVCRFLFDRGYSTGTPLLGSYRLHCRAGSKALRRSARRLMSSRFKPD